jgi:hypothetical protein
LVWIPIQLHALQLNTKIKTNLTKTTTTTKKINQNQIKSKIKLKTKTKPFPLYDKYLALIVKKNSNVFSFPCQTHDPFFNTTWAQEERFTVGVSLIQKTKKKKNQTNN